MTNYCIFANKPSRDQKMRCIIGISGTKSMIAVFYDKSQNTTVNKYPWYYKWKYQNTTISEYYATVLLIQVSKLSW